MVTQPESDTAAPEAPPDGLAGSTYEIIRNRLENSGADLRSRLDQLNESRKDIFGSIDTALLSTERIATEHNCIARDMVSIGDRFLFGYNVVANVLNDLFQVGLGLLK